MIARDAHSLIEKLKALPPQRITHQMSTAADAASGRGADQCSKNQCSLGED